MRTRVDQFTLDRLLVAEAFLLIATVALIMTAQNDTWWHLAAGRDMVNSGRIALTETWSHTANGSRWPNYEWLSQILFFTAYRTGGLPLLTVLLAAAIVCTYVMVWRLTRGPELARALMLLASVANSTIIWAVRPQILSLFLVSVALWLIVTRRLAWLPPLFLLWANLHGAVAVGGLLIVAMLLASAMTDRASLPKVLLVAALCFLAGFLTPLGLGYWWEVASAVEKSRLAQLDEWQRPAVGAGQAVFWIAVVTLLTLATVRRDWTRRFDDAAVVTGALLLVPLALTARRTVPMFLLVALPAVTRLLWPADWRARPFKEVVGAWRAAFHGGVLVASMLGAGVFVCRQWTLRPDAMGWTPLSREAAEAIRACTPPMYNPFNEGGFLVWFVPEQRVFLDSRLIPYPLGLVQEHTRAEQTGNYDALFARFSIQCAVFPASSGGPSRLGAEGWSEQYRDAEWVVLEEPD